MIWPFSLLATPTATPKAKRDYKGATRDRLSLTLRGANTSADTELASSLTMLRANARALVRDVPYARRARAIVVNNVIGPGVGLQARVMSTRRVLRKKINDEIEGLFDLWSRSEHCHTGGTLHFADLERAIMAEVFTAGEAFVRIHPMPFAGSPVPLALELIESERLAELNEVGRVLPAGHALRMGVEVDRYQRPVAYWLRDRHPNEARPGVDGRAQSVMRVPADEMMHLRIVHRWPQTRGEPWLHAVIHRVHQLGEFEEAAVVAARVGASKIGFFENPDYAEGATDDVETTGGEHEVKAGSFSELPPGYKFSGWDPNYPDEAVEPFLRALLRGMAAGLDVSYESLTRDYSQSNYSSSRLSALDDRDGWRVLQAWWVRSFREPLHRRWLAQAVLARALSIGVQEYALAPARFEAARFKTRGWSWVDPTKEVSAYKEAVRAGFTTVSDVIAATAGGQDLEDILDTRRDELDAMAAAGLTFDTDTAQASLGSPPGDDADTSTDEGDDPVEPAPRLFKFQGVAK